MQLKKWSRQGGMTILEVMIGIAITGTMLASAMLLMSRADNETSGRSDADSLASFQQIAGQYFMANRDDIDAAMAGDSAKAAIHCRINVAPDGSGGTVQFNATKHTCVFDTTLLRANGVWPTGMSVDLSPTNRWVAITRQIMTTTAPIQPSGADEMLVVMATTDGAGSVRTSGTVTFAGDKRRSGEELSAAMDALGGTGGYVPPGQDFGGCKYNATTKQACGHGWAVNLDDFVN